MLHCTNRRIWFLVLSAVPHLSTPERCRLGRAQLSLVQVQLGRTRRWEVHVCAPEKTGARTGWIERGFQDSDWIGLWLQAG